MHWAHCAVSNMNVKSRRIGVISLLLCFLRIVVESFCTTLWTLSAAPRTHAQDKSDGEISPMKDFSVDEASVCHRQYKRK